jgi:hypothetical protein
MSVYGLLRNCNFLWIVDMDADMITIETSRSDTGLLERELNPRINANATAIPAVAEKKFCPVKGSIYAQ